MGAQHELITDYNSNKILKEKTERRRGLTNTPRRVGIYAILQALKLVHWRVAYFFCFRSRHCFQFSHSETTPPMPLRPNGYPQNESQTQMGTKILVFTDVKIGT